MSESTNDARSADVATESPAAAAYAGAAAAADAETREILNLLGDADAGGSCCGGSCCAA